MTRGGRRETPLSTKLFYGFGAVAFGVKQNGFAFFVTAFRISRMSHEETLHKLAGSAG